MLSTIMAVWSVVEMIIAWVNSGKSLYNFYKDLKNQKEEKEKNKIEKFRKKKQYYRYGKNKIGRQNTIARVKLAKQRGM